MSCLSLAALIDRAASEHKRSRRGGMRLSRSRKPVTTLRGITWETSDTTRVSTTGRKEQNGQDDSSSVGCSPGSLLGLAKAEVRDTDFPSPSQLSVPSAEVEKTRLTLPSWAASVPGAESKKTQVYHVYPTLGVQTRATRACIVWAFLFLFAIEYISRLAFSVFVRHRCHIAFLRRDIISLGGRVACINQSTNHPYLLIFCLKWNVEHPPPQVTYNSPGTAKRHAHERGY